jgi:hypothetical protein
LVAELRPATHKPETIESRHASMAQMPVRWRFTRASLE